MHVLPLIFFAFTYLGFALGEIPRLKLDRTGFAVLGAVAFLATGEITLEQAKDAIDAPTMVVLFGMMMLSVQYQLSGLYKAIGDRLARVGNPRRLLVATIVASGGLSAILTNDVVCFALTPLLVTALIEARLDPLPYLIAFACASNIGSALTPIGNPQNILIAQKLNLPFLPFVAACAVPVLISMIFLYWIVVRSASFQREHMATDLPPEKENIDKDGAAKAIILTVATMILFMTSIPTYLTALGVAGVVMLSRKLHTRSLLALVDWQLLAMFAGLFVVVRGLELSGWVESAKDALLSVGADLSSPLVNLPVVIALGNLVGNVPAVMLLLPLVHPDARTGHGLALASTFGGNSVLMASIANIIVAEQASRLGIRIGFRDHLRIGLPVTVISLAIVAVAVVIWHVAKS